MFGAIGGFITFIIIAVIILFVLSTCIRVVPQAQALVVERLGAYLGTYSVGIHFLVPFIDRVAKKVNLKEQVEDFPPQLLLTTLSPQVHPHNLEYLRKIKSRTLFYYFSTL